MPPSVKGYMAERVTGQMKNFKNLISRFYLFLNLSAILTRLDESAVSLFGTLLHFDCKVFGHTFEDEVD